ncbi:uncharacterized protein B0T15DRAFT_386593, partial [Chaetomium strumarium]
GTIRHRLREMVPKHPACEKAFSIAQADLPAPIFNHSFRVFLYAQTFMISEFPGPDAPGAVTLRHEFKPPPYLEAPSVRDPNRSVALFVACMLHAYRTDPRYDATAMRFELCGADATAKVLGRHGFSVLTIREAWLAVALHTTPRIAEDLNGIIRALRLAVRADFHCFPLPNLRLLPGGFQPGELSRLIDAELPRLDVEKALADRIVDWARNKPDEVFERAKAPRSTWPGELVEVMRADSQLSRWRVMGLESGTALNRAFY